MIQNNDRIELIVKIFEHLELDPRLAGYSPQRIEHCFDIFEKNKGHPLLSQIIDTVSIECKEITRDFDETSRYYNTVGGFFERFKEFYGDNSTENRGREPSELIELISRFREQPLPLADMSYESVREKLSKNTTICKSLPLENMFSLLVAVGSGIGSYLLSSNLNYAIGMGTICTIATTDYAKTWFTIIRDEREWKRMLREDSTLKNYNELLGTASSLDTILPLYRALSRNKN